MLNGSRRTGLDSCCEPPSELLPPPKHILPQASNRLYSLGEGSIYIQKPSVVGIESEWDVFREARYRRLVLDNFANVCGWESSIVATSSMLLIEEYINSIWSLSGGQEASPWQQTFYI